MRARLGALTLGLAMTLAWLVRRRCWPRRCHWINERMIGGRYQAECLNCPRVMR